MADASTISGSSSIAIKPELLFCDDEADCVGADEDVFVAVPPVSPVFADVIADADVLDPLEPLVLSGTPPANAFDVLKAKAPTTSDFSRWRIYCAPHNSKHLNGMASLNISTLIRMTYAEIILP